MSDNVERVRFGDEKDDGPWYIAPDGETCPDCGVDQGELHDSGCDVEQCPICHTQLIGCDHGEAILSGIEHDE